MPLAPWKVRVTADGTGTLDAVHATVELVDRARHTAGGTPLMSFHTLGGSNAWVEAFNIDTATLWGPVTTGLYSFIGGGQAGTAISAGEADNALSGPSPNVWVFNSTGLAASRRVVDLDPAPAAGTQGDDPILYGAALDSEGMAYVAGSGILTKFDPSIDPQYGRYGPDDVAWQVALPDDKSGSIVVDGGTVWVGARGNWTSSTPLEKRSTSDGSSLWAGSQVDFWLVTRPLLAAGDVFVGDSRGQVVRVDSTSGNQLWATRITPETFHEVHGLAFDGSHLWAAGGGVLAKLDLNGTVVQSWSPAGWPATGDYKVEASGGLVYVGRRQFGQGHNGFVEVFDMNGQSLHLRDLGIDVWPTASALLL